MAKECSYKYAQAAMSEFAETPIKEYNYVFAGKELPRSALGGFVGFLEKTAALF